MPIGTKGNMLLTRRDALVGCASLCAAGAQAPSALAQCRAPPGGCSVFRSERPANFVEETLDDDFILRSTGAEELDRFLGPMLVGMAQMFGVGPGFGLYDDVEGENALAYRQTFLPSTRHTVVLGQRLLVRQTTNYQDGGLSVIAILAHEFGHILQYERVHEEALAQADGGVRLFELHADYLAGMYLGFRKRRDQRLPTWSSGRTFELLGDTAFGDRDHHGTPEERVRAIEAGFRIGYDRQRLPRIGLRESVGAIRTAFSRSQ